MHKTNEILQICENDQKILICNLADVLFTFRNFLTYAHATSRPIRLQDLKFPRIFKTTKQKSQTL